MPVGLPQGLDLMLANSNIVIGISFCEAWSQAWKGLYGSPVGRLLSGDRGGQVGTQMRYYHCIQMTKSSWLIVNYKQYPVLLEMDGTLMKN